MKIRLLNGTDALTDVLALNGSGRIIAQGDAYLRGDNIELGPDTNDDDSNPHKTKISHVDNKGLTIVSYNHLNDATESEEILRLQRRTASMNASSWDGVGSKIVFEQQMTLLSVMQDIVEIEATGKNDGQHQGEFGVNVMEDSVITGKRAFTITPDKIHHEHDTHIETGEIFLGPADAALKIGRSSNGSVLMQNTYSAAKDINIGLVGDAAKQSCFQFMTGGFYKWTAGQDDAQGNDFIISNSATGDLSGDKVLQIEHDTEAATFSGTVTANSVLLTGVPEGTEVLSTGETGAAKFLREDGDGTCSWQTVPAGGNPEGTDVISTGVSSGKVLTADGSDGATWEDAGGGSGGITTGKAIAMAMIFG